MQKNVLIVVGVVLLAAIAVGGWYFYENTRGTVIGEDGSKIKYTTDGKTTTAKSENGTFAAGENVKIPSDFPKNLPVYSGIKLDMAWNGNMDENDPESENIKAGYTGTIMKTCKDVSEWYRAELEKLGWKVDVSLNGGMTLSNAKEISSFTTDASENSCAVTLTVMDKSEVTGGAAEYSNMTKEAKEMEELQRQMDAGEIKY